jgi:ABC-type multidrug transport system permease subunit
MLLLIPIARFLFSFELGKTYLYHWKFELVTLRIERLEFALLSSSMYIYCMFIINGQNA